MKRTIIIWLFCITSISGKPYPNLKLSSLLTYDQMKAIGITEMSVAQQEALRLALIQKFQQGFREGEKSRLSVPIEPTAQVQPRVIESRINGEFEGWSGETIFKLMNGEIWQQTEYHYHYHYAYMPSVVIFRSGVGYKMKVDGISKAVGVTKIK